MSEFKEIKKDQWQRKVDDEYEMCWVRKSEPYVEMESWYVVVGWFALADYQQEEVDWARENHELPADASDDDVASALFENCAPDFDVHDFDSRKEALAFADGWMSGRD